MVAVESTTIKFVQLRAKSIPSEQLVLLVELFKLIVSSISYALYDVPLNNELRRPLLQSSNEDGHDADPLERRDTSSIVWFVLPACLYAVSNNVTFAALMLMSPALFNLLMNLKIPLTGVMACVLLRYRLTKSLAFSFVFLFLGSIVATLTWDRNGHVTIEGSVHGLVLMIVYALCSAGAAVYTEYVTKSRYPNESINLQNVKFCACSVVANAIIVALRGELPFEKLVPLHFASVTALAMNGLITSAVLKYAGSIVKTFAVSCAAFPAAVFTYVLFNESLRWNFYLGALVCIISVNIYIVERMSDSGNLSRS